MSPSVASMESRWKFAACIFAVTLIGHVEAISAQAAKPNSPIPERPLRVVVLNATDPTLPAFMAIDKGTRAAFADPGGPRFDVYSETLDVMRFANANFEPEILAPISKKYANIPIDAVIALSPPGLDFAMRYRDRLWPDAPIIFHSIPESALRGRTLPPATTGLYNRLDYAGTVDLALRLRPLLSRHC